MKFTSTIILILIIQDSLGQIEFTGDSLRNLKYNTIIGHPNFDTVDFVLRYWIEAGEISGTFAELSLSKNQQWKYRTGYVNFIERKLIIKDVGLRAIDLDSTWKALDQLEILTIKKQVESVWTGTNDVGQSFRVRTKPEIYESGKGNWYTIELIEKDKYRNLLYSDPERIIKMYGQIHATSIDHERFVQISNMLYVKFYIWKIMKERWSELYSRTKESEKKEKKSGVN